MGWQRGASFGKMAGNQNMNPPGSIIAWGEKARDYWEAFLGLFYPNVCQICNEGEAGQREGYVCARCWTRPDGIQFIVAPFCRVCGLPFEGEMTGGFECGNCRDERLYFHSARAAVRLSGLVQEVIHKYKYNHAAWFEPFLSDLLLREALPVVQNETYDYIVPIPLHWRKRQARSFNQAEALARVLGKTTGIPVHKRLLKRVKPTETQTRLTRAQRAANVQHAFAWRGQEALQGERILLFDDVLTTGATANACAKLLMANGAGRVDVWTVARGILK